MIYTCCCWWTIQCVCVFDGSPAPSSDRSPFDSGIIGAGGRWMPCIIWWGAQPSGADVTCIVNASSSSRWITFPTACSTFSARWNSNFIDTVKKTVHISLQMEWKRRSSTGILVQIDLRKSKEWEFAFVLNLFSGIGNFWFPGIISKSRNKQKVRHLWETNKNP
jgi:hypothetical protein